MASMIRSFSIREEACLIFLAVSLIVVRIFWMLKYLNRSVISLRELIKLSCWTFEVWSLGGPQGLLCVGGGVGLVGRAGKFSLVTVGGVAVSLAVEVIDLRTVVVVGSVDFNLAVLSALSFVLYRKQPL